jgi:hypothetical protein
MGEAKRRGSTAGEWKNTFRIGDYVCEMTYRSGGGLKASWRPDVPKQLSPQQWDQYRAGRDALFAEVSDAIGGSVLVVEV